MMKNYYIVIKLFDNGILLKISYIFKIEKALHWLKTKRGNYYVFRNRTSYFAQVPGR